MNNRTLFFSISALSMALGSIPLTGCGYLKARSARAAYGQYQDAIAAGDMQRARNALITLVRSDEDVADYWAELGKLQIQMGDYRGAYDAFSHAHELNRSDIEVLSTLTQIALLAGETDVAVDHARSLALVSPDNPVVTLVNGFVAYKSGELDKANAAADRVLASSPTDPFAKMLKARVYLSTNRWDDAVALLEAQHRTVPQDANAIKTLSEIYRSRADWSKLAQVQNDLLRLHPKDTVAAQTAVEALLRAGDVNRAARMSVPLLSPSASPQLVATTLSLWSRYAPVGQSIPGGMKLATAVTGDQRVSFGDYFNRIGQPRAAESLLGSSPLPVSHSNARHNAVLAQAMALQGRAPQAKALFDAVLDQEPDQVEALRGRAALEARTGMVKQAVIDASRLVTISTDEGEDRLILAQAQRAAGSANEVRRTLWQAFQDLPGDERVLAALKSVLASSGDTDSLRRVDEEVADRKTDKLTKELI